MKGVLRGRLWDRHLVSLGSAILPKSKRITNLIFTPCIQSDNRVNRWKTFRVAGWSNVVHTIDKDPFGAHVGKIMLDPIA